MRVLLVALLCTFGCGGSDFAPPGPPDAQIERDLSVGTANPFDAGCFNKACGGCSTWARPDGTPAMSGDPCLWAGTLACNGTTLACSSNACPTCAGNISGTVCGADGHTIVEFTNGGTCSVFSTGSATAVCNRSVGDACAHRCTATAGGYDCTAWCKSDADAGAVGCSHQAGATCTTLAACP